MRLLLLCVASSIKSASRLREEHVVRPSVFLNLSYVTIDHVMPREKRCGALDSCFGLVRHMYVS